MRRVSFQQGLDEVGLFASENSTLPTLANKIYGFIEYISREHFEILQERRFPSLYRYFEEGSASILKMASCF
jgi:hypothetical protein